MNKTFHQLSPEIALNHMPETFRAFLICETYTLDNLRTDSDLPDLTDHDNIAQTSEIHHAHSFKMAEVDGKLKWLDGDVLERLKGLCADAHDFHAENKPDLVRYCLGKATHYRIDALTYPHLHRGQPWSKHHEAFETELGSFLSKNRDKIGPIDFQPYKDIYKDCRNTAGDMWHLGKDVVAQLERNEVLTNEQKMDICRKCVKGVGDLWMTMAVELKL